MIISPGSLPNHGILSPMSKKMPIKIMKTPSRMSIFPKGPNPKIVTSLLKVQMSKPKVQRNVKTGKLKALALIYINPKGLSYTLPSFDI